MEIDTVAPSPGRYARARGGLIEWLRAFWPTPIAADWRERLRVIVGAALGIAVTGLVCHHYGTFGRHYGVFALQVWPWLIAPMGASAVLVFAVPANPLSQPWAVVGGNTVSALVGVACVQLSGTPEWSAALAVGGAVSLMFALRCLHPPAGGTALLVALLGISDPHFVLFPVLANSVILVAVGMAYNGATRRPYPHRQLPQSAPTGRDAAAADPLDAALDTVLTRYNQVLGISRDDLQTLLADTQLQAYQRKLSGLRCADVMSRNLITVNHATPVQQAWALFREHRIKALPVVDAAGGIVGIVTPADFLNAAEIHEVDDFNMRMKSLRNWIKRAVQGKPQVVGTIMTRQVRVASAERNLTELIPLFGSTGHHHIPIVGDGGRLVGIITQSDVVAALCETQPALA